MGEISMSNTGIVAISSDMDFLTFSPVQYYTIDWINSFYSNQNIINALKNKRYSGSFNHNQLMYEVEFNSSLNFNLFKILRAFDGENPIQYKFNKFIFEDINKLSAFIAYILATFKHETGGIKSDFLYSPVREGYFISGGIGSNAWLQYLRSKNYRGPKYPPGHPYVGVPIYYGRGLVELTNIDNYDKLNDVINAKIINFNQSLVKDPDLALDFDIAMLIAIEGMLDGFFTGVSLKSVWKEFSNDTLRFFYECRPIINSYDQADQIAEYAMDFYKSMLINPLN